MELTLASNPLCRDIQTLEVEKVAALIGKNGSGKSLILESIFKQKTNHTDYENLNIICFSSGQNENYSLLYSNYLRLKRRRKNSINLDCFYYDKSWARLLIFLATSLKKDGKARYFLRERDYIDESDDIRDDISTTLHCPFKVRKDYIARVSNALAQEEEEGTVDTLRITPFFRTLDSFISCIIDSNYSFDQPLSQVIKITALNLFEVSFDFSSQRQSEDEEGGENGAIQYFTPELAFFTQASDNNYFIDRSKIKLTFKQNLELAQLSDGEYQILFLYALLDLFDKDNTLFLLDEVDSHLHHENIELLWNNLHNIKGYAITTTHLLDSITAKENTIDHLKVVENGKIDEANKCRQLIERLKVLSRGQSTEFAFCAKVPYIVLIDDDNDWDIFSLLAERKGLDITQLEKIHTVKKTSSYTTSSEEFAKAKLDWVYGFSQCDTAIQTKHLFLLCDRDEASLEFKQNGVEVKGSKSKIKNIQKAMPNSSKLYLLAWQRREVKHYLLSYTALRKYGKVGCINGELPSRYCLKPNCCADNNNICTLKSDIVKGVINDLINIPGKGLCCEKLKEYISYIPPEEISKDIENMYKFIVEKLN